MHVSIGVDLGTHGARLVAFDMDDHVIIGSIKVDYSRVENTSLQEQDAELWWDTFVEGIKKIQEIIPWNSIIKGLGITHQRGTLVPVTTEIVPKRNALCDSDERHVAFYDVIDNGFEQLEDYYKISGCPFVSFNGLTKILWCKQYEPEIFDGNLIWLSPQDFIMSRLTKNITGSVGSALRNGVLSVEHQVISQTTLEMLGLQENWFPPYLKIGESAGCIHKEVADELGLPQGVEVIAVPGDQPSAVVSSGSLLDDSIAINLGTTFVASKITKQIYCDAELISTTEILSDDLYELEFGSGAGGQFLDWYMKLSNNGKLPQGNEIWERVNAIAESISCGAGGSVVIPLLWQATSPDVFGGILNLRSWHTEAHIVRAIFEGLAMEVRLAIEKVEKVTGTKNSSIRVFGGCSRMSTFVNILSSVTNRKVISNGEIEASALGAAFIVAYALGDYENMEELVAKVSLTTVGEFSPNYNDSNFYEGLFLRYCELRSKINA